MIPWVFTSYIPYFSVIEKNIVNIVKSIGIGILKIQSSLEDSMSTLSLLLELLSALSILLILVIFGGVTDFI